MRRFLLGVAGAAFGLASVNAASAATVASLIASNLVGTGEVQFEDLSVETITSGDGDNLLEDGETLTGYAYIDNLIVGGNTLALGGSNSAVIAKFTSTVASSSVVPFVGVVYTFSDPTVSFYEILDGDANGIDQTTLLGASIADIETGIAEGTNILTLGFTGDTGEGWLAIANTDDLTATALDVSFRANLSVLSSTLPVIFSDNSRTQGVGALGDGSGTEGFLTGRAFPNAVSNPELPVQDDADLFVTVTVIPEPVTAGLGLIGLGALALRRRRA